MAEAAVGEAQAAVRRAIGEGFATYVRLIESFVCGRMTKEELEGSLRLVLQDDVRNYDLHNTYVGLVLEKIAEVEGAAREELQSMADASCPAASARLALDTLALSSADAQLFADAAARPLPVRPCCVRACDDA